VAGQGAALGLGEGGTPFSPDAHNPADPDFGFQPGQLYTLKWAPPGQRNKPGGRCPGDIAFDPGGGSSDRGYIDIGQGNGNSALHDVIVNGGYNLPQPLQVGSVVDHVQGNKHVGPAVETRFSQDGDTSSTDIASYLANTSANGRRIMVLPVNNAQEPAVVVGFGTFLLLEDSCTGNNKPCCGIYVGNSPVLYGQRDGAGPGGLYVVKLYQ
jgi:hypothetical protein